MLISVEESFVMVWFGFLLASEGRAVTGENSESVGVRRFYRCHPTFWKQPTVLIQTYHSYNWYISTQSQDLQESGTPASLLCSRNEED
ncbi:hypothetical protein O3P69_008894 [Scylla paramamosain]|uniref:Secreted protein n=1 Tax=Scylla paramamosain TaxID=85552 RepID=A0AAW0TPW8_SCYPA